MAGNLRGRCAVALGLVVLLSVAVSAKAQNPAPRTKQTKPNGQPPQPPARNAAPPSAAGRAAPPAKQPPAPRTAQPAQSPQQVPRASTRPRDVVPATAVEPADEAPPQPPFTLTPQQQANLDRLLTDWEKRNASIRTITCQFERWEYDRTTNTRKYANGELKYKNPDNAEYQVLDASGATTEHWLCDGTSIYEFKHSEKTLVQRELPPALQGKAIEDGPLPFVFNANAQKLKDRYWLRLTAPPEGVQDQVWLEAMPKRREERANFERAELILDAKELLPVAVQIHTPGGQTRTVHKLKNTKVNPFWAGLKGFKPKVDRDWKLYVERADGLAEGPASPPPTDPAAKPIATRQPRQGAQRE